MESYFSRWASVLGSVRSLTATNSRPWSAMAVRRMLRPMRPKPLMPTLMAMISSEKRMPSENTPAVHHQQSACVTAGRGLLSAALLCYKANMQKWRDRGRRRRKKGPPSDVEATGRVGQPKSSDTSRPAPLQPSYMDHFDRPAPVAGIAPDAGKPQVVVETQPESPY